MSITSVQQETSSPMVVMPRLSVEMAGALAGAFGAWGGIVPFVGPIFGFSADGTPSWTWNLQHAVLFLAPGAAAFVGGLAIIVGSRWALGRYVGLALAGALVAVAGAWFIVGPLAWPVLHNASVFTTSSSALRSLEYWIGYSLGPGGILIALGSFAFARPTPLVARAPLNPGMGAHSASE
ncbi:MAG: hypothetical protein WCF24_04195 [Acidimicrobiales bacterium]